MEVHEVCKRFLHELAREMSEQAEVIDEHSSLARAHRKLLSQKLELRQSLLDVQQRRATVEEELRAAHRVQAVRCAKHRGIIEWPKLFAIRLQGLKEEHEKASGISQFLTDLEVRNNCPISRHEIYNHHGTCVIV